MAFNAPRALRGTASGAAAGSMFGPAGTGIGAGLGFLSSLFGDSDEETMAKRLDQWLKILSGVEERTLREGTGLISRQTSSLMGQAGGRGERLARSLGRSDIAEAFRAPAEARVGKAGSEALQNFVSGTTQKFNDLRLQAQGEFASRPIEPDMLDTLELIGNAGLRWKQGQDLLKILAGGDMGEGMGRGEPVLDMLGTPPEAGGASFGLRGNRTQGLNLGNNRDKITRLLTLLGSFG